jgi:hypothetical protein
MLYPYLPPILREHDLLHLHLEFFLFHFQQQINHWAKPATGSLISGILSDLTRSRSDLIVEKALLRHQLISSIDS